MGGGNLLSAANSNHRFGNHCLQTLGEPSKLQQRREKIKEKGFFLAVPNSGLKPTLVQRRSETMNVLFGSRELNSQLSFSVRKGFAFSASLASFSVGNGSCCELGSRRI